MATKNIYSVKSTMYPNGRSKDMDGPWKPTVEAAITAFVEMLQKKGLETLSVRRPFVAERCDKSVAPSGDSRGNWYRTVEFPELATRLASLGLSV